VLRVVHGYKNAPVDRFVYTDERETRKSKSTALDLLTNVTEKSLCSIALLITLDYESKLSIHARLMNSNIPGDTTISHFVQTALACLANISS
jgi:hypothetical protein